MLGLVSLALIWVGPIAIGMARLVCGPHARPYGRRRHRCAADRDRRFVTVGRPVRFISLPIFASLVELVVVWGWHAPAARLWAETFDLRHRIASRRRSSAPDCSCGTPAYVIQWGQPCPPGGRRVRSASDLRPHDAARRAAGAGPRPLYGLADCHLLWHRARRRPGPGSSAASSCC